MRPVPGLRTAIVLCALVAPAMAWGQSARDVKVDAAGTCPPDNVMRGFPRVTQPKVGIGETLTKLPDTVLDRSEFGSEPTEVTIDFNTLLVVYGFSSDERKLFVRVVPSPGEATASSCGWVSADRVLIPRERKFQDRFKKPQPLQMRDISALHRAAENQLNVKAVVHDLSITGVTTGIDIFQDPASGNPTDSIKLFDAFLVFDQLELPGGDARQENRFWLIGEEVGSSRAASLKGWIRQRDVVIWPNRLAVQWNEAATVSGYASPENLNRKTGQMTLPEKIERADYPEQITRRLPVLEQSPSPDAVVNALPIGGTLEERKAVASNMIRYYRIATPGLACLKDNPADCLSAREIDVRRERAVSIESAIRKVDILILIDATQSMDPYFAATVQTIESLLRKTESEDIRKVFDLRFAISLYGDYRSDEASENNVDYNEIVPFFKAAPGQLTASQALRALRSGSKSLVFGDVHRDRLEAPFAAVMRAARTARWRPLKEVPLRFVVHIGDAGNRDQGRTAAATQQARYPGAAEHKNPPQSAVRERYNEQDVVTALRAASAIYVPLAIVDGSPEMPTPTLANKILTDQANRILTLLGDDAPVKEAVITYSSELARGVEKQVTETVQTVMTKVIGGIELQKCDRNSRSPGCIRLKEHQAELMRPEIVKLVSRVASEAAGMPAHEVKNVYSREQSIVTMYSPARSVEGRDMFTHWVVLQQNEFSVLRSLLQKLCTRMAQQDARSPVMTALREFSEMYAHEDFSDLSVREILGKRLGIPNLEQTDFSGRTREEIDDAYRAWQSGQGGETWKNWHVRACKADAFTRYMEDGKKVNPDAIKCDSKTSRCAAPETEQRRFRWSVRVSQDAPTYYVPLDILP